MADEAKNRWKDAFLIIATVVLFTLMFADYGTDEK